MKTLLLNLALVVGLASCTTNQPLNDKLVSVGVELITLGMAQNATTPEPLPRTLSK
jgi:hypothetical protein